MPDTCTHMPRPRTRAAERGFSVVELIVVMVIVAILAAAAIMTFRSAKGTSYQKEAITAATTYSQAIASFQSDHAKRNPSPTDPAHFAADKALGPLNLLGKPYAGAKPEAVVDGRVGVGVYPSIGGANCNNTKSAPGSTAAWVSICLGPDPQYAVRVLARKHPGDPWNAPETTLCWMGSTTQTPRC